MRCPGWLLTFTERRDDPSRGSRGPAFKDTGKPVLFAFLFFSHVMNELHRRHGETEIPPCFRRGLRDAYGDADDDDDGDGDYTCM